MNRACSRGLDWGAAAPQTAAMTERILIVDDEPGILEQLSQVLAEEGYEVVTTPSGDEAVRLYRQQQPDVVFLDIWLPDRDGLETLAALMKIDPAAAVVMISGHGTAPTAVKSIKMGACNYLEKPLSLEGVLEAVKDALEHRRARQGVPPAVAAELERAARTEFREVLSPPPAFPAVQLTQEPQRTIRAAAVIYGLGLHSGRRTGMVIQPLPPDSGIHFLTLPGGARIPAHILATTDTDYATTLAGGGETIRTVEHFLAVLHAAGVTNLLIKVHGEIPVLDGSGLEFCQRLEEIGIVDQDVPRREVVIDRTYRLESGARSIILEPAETFAVSYFLRYPPPLGEQFYEFTGGSYQAFKEQIAPARTFGFLRDLKMINELGLGSGGRLDNFILVGEESVINTTLRFPDEFVRHKILDIIGDLYLLGFPMRGRVTARLTGHRDNIAIQRHLLEEWGLLSG